jgi:hypothetical protein
VQPKRNRRVKIKTVKMKVIAMQIEGLRMNIVVFEKKANGVTELTGKVKFLELNENHDSATTKSFMNVIHRHFDSISADKIAIVKRNANGKGMHKPSPISFKVEALIQLYEKQNVELISPLTIKAFLKKCQEPLVTSKLKYQKDIFELANYLMYN